MVKELPIIEYDDIDPRVQWIAGYVAETMWGDKERARQILKQNCNKEALYKV
jgi:Zn-dependent M16 (insulinase) family peptidase